VEFLYAEEDNVCVVPERFSEAVKIVHRDHGTGRRHSKAQ
jgi:hypothetical protein